MDPARPNRENPNSSFLPFSRVKAPFRARRASKPITLPSLQTSNLSDALQSELNSCESFSVQYESLKPPEPKPQPQPALEDSSRLPQLIQQKLAQRRQNLLSYFAPKIAESEEDSSRLDDPRPILLRQELEITYRSMRDQPELKCPNLGNFASSQKQRRNTGAMHTSRLFLDSEPEHNRLSALNGELLARNDCLTEEAALLRELLALFGIKFELPPGFLNVREQLEDIKQRLGYFITLEERFNDLTLEFLRLKDNYESQEAAFCLLKTQKLTEKNEKVSGQKTSGKLDSLCLKAQLAKAKEEIGRLGHRLSETTDELLRSHNAYEALEKTLEVSELVHRQRILAIESKLRTDLSALKASADRAKADLDSFHSFFLLLSKIRLLTRAKDLKLKKLEIVQNSNNELRRILRSFSFAAEEKVWPEKHLLGSNPSIKSQWRLDSLGQLSKADSKEAQGCGGSPSGHKSREERLAKLARQVEGLELAGDYLGEQSARRLEHLSEQIAVLKSTQAEQAEKLRTKISALEADRSKLHFQNKNLLIELRIFDEKMHCLISEKELLEEQLSQKEELEEKNKDLQLKLRLLENKLELAESIKEIQSHHRPSDEERALFESEALVNRRFTREKGLNRTIDEANESQENFDSRQFDSHVLSRRSNGHPGQLLASNLQKKALDRKLEIAFVFAQGFNLEGGVRLEKAVQAFADPELLGFGRSIGLRDERPLTGDPGPRSTQAAKRKLFDKKEILKSISDLPKTLKDNQSVCGERSDRKIEISRIEQSEVFRLNLLKTKAKIEGLQNKGFKGLERFVWSLSSNMSLRLENILATIAALQRPSALLGRVSRPSSSDAVRQMDSVGHYKLVPKIVELGRLELSKLEGQKNLSSLEKQRKASHRKSAKLPRKVEIDRPSSLGVSKSNKLLVRKTEPEDKKLVIKSSDRFGELLKNFAHNRAVAKDKSKDQLALTLGEQTAHFQPLNIFQGKSLKDFASNDSKSRSPANFKENKDEAKISGNENIFTAKYEKKQMEFENSKNEENAENDLNELDSLHRSSKNKGLVQLESESFEYQSFQKLRTSSPKQHRPSESEPEEQLNPYVEISKLRLFVCDLEEQILGFSSKSAQLEQNLFNEKQTSSRFESIITESIEIAFKNLPQRIKSPDLEPEQLPVMIQALCRNKSDLQERLETHERELKDLKNELFCLGSANKNPTLESKNSLENIEKKNRNSENNAIEFRKRNSLENTFGNFPRSSTAKNARQTTERQSDLAESQLEKFESLRSRLGVSNARESFQQFQERQLLIQSGFGQLINYSKMLLEQNSEILASLLNKNQADLSYKNFEESQKEPAEKIPGVSDKVPQLLANNNCISDHLQFIAETLNTLLNEFVAYKTEQSKIKETYQSPLAQHKSGLSSKNELAVLSSSAKMNTPVKNSDEIGDYLCPLLEIGSGIKFEEPQQKSKRPPNTPENISESNLRRTEGIGQALVNPNHAVSELLQPRETERLNLERGYELLLTMLLQFKAVLDASDLDERSKLAQLAGLAAELDNLFAKQQSKRPARPTYDLPAEGPSDLRRPSKPFSEPKWKVEQFAQRAGRDKFPVLPAEDRDAGLAPGFFLPAATQAGSRAGGTERPADTKRKRGRLRSLSI